MDARQERGLIIAATTKLAEQFGVWVVPSSTGDKRYMVDPKKGSCTCPDHSETGFKCKHLYAVEFTVKRETARDGTITETKTFTFTEKKTYAQDWKAYNLAQSIEKDRFQELLFDLCRNVADLPAPKTGRRPHKTKDAIFSMAFKVYSMFSARRFSTDLRDAHKKGYLVNPIPGMKVCAFFENEAFTPILVELIQKASVPLKTVETEFAVDSSGFSSSRHVRWFDEKYGRERTEKTWVKTHIACGVKTNVVTAIEILDKDAADSPRLPGLLKTTAENFTVKEVSADKAYLSVDNVEKICQAGGTPYIAIKSNTTGTAGGLFEKMVRDYESNKYLYMDHYHKRSNVESTFSMIKAKFRDEVRSKTDVAMKNEVLAKVLCHNLCCVIQSQCELGIEAAFWSKEEASPAA